MFWSSAGIIIISLSFTYRLIFTSARIIYVSSESSCLNNIIACSGTRTFPFANLFQALNFIEGNALKTSTFYVRLLSEVILSGGGLTAPKNFFNDVAESNLTIIFEKEANLKQSTIILNGFPFSISIPKLIIIDGIKFLFLFNTTDGIAPQTAQG